MSSQIKKRLGREKEEQFYLKNAFSITLYKKLDIYVVFLILIVLGSIYTFSYKINKLMYFIGDQAWFYLSARDLISNGAIPLVGIASSRPWLHQGPFWTYMLAIALKIGNFDPISGAYLTIFLGIISIYLIYKTCKELFSRRVGLIAAILYASSPLVILNSRLPYHTSPIPLLAIIYILFLYKFITGNKWFFPWIILVLTLLYGFQLSTFPFIAVFFFILLYGFLNKSIWLTNIYDRKIIFTSLIFFILPMIPILIYDFYNGFTQTFGFTAWIFYSLLKPLLNFFGIIPQTVNNHNFWQFLYINTQKLIFIPNGFISVSLLFCSVYLLLRKIILIIKMKEFENSYILVFIIFLFPTLGLILMKTPSDAYLPIFYPIIIIIVALFIDNFGRMKFGRFFILLIVSILCIANIITIYKMNFYSGYTTLENRTKLVKSFLIELSGKSYNLEGNGWLKEHESYIMNYEYLAWWLGHAPSDNKENLKVIIYEDEKGIRYDLKNENKK